MEGPMKCESGELQARDQGWQYGSSLCVVLGGGFGGVTGFVDGALVGGILPTVRYLCILSSRSCPMPLMARRSSTLLYPP